MKTKTLLLRLLLILCFNPAIGQEKRTESESPLSPFSRLIGGEWHLGDSFQVFEWGVGNLSVKSKSYVTVEGKPKLVSEGNWFWHPKDQQIKGYFTAIGMPAELFEYTSTFKENEMANTLITYSANGKAEVYLEVWTFVDQDKYMWTLYNSATKEPQKIMEGIYQRKKIE